MTQTDPGDVTAQVYAVCRGFRRWALAHPQEFALVFASTEDALGSCVPERDLPVVVTCRTGQASASAAKRLKKAGFEQVYWLDGGVQAWQQADLPLVKGRG